MTETEKILTAADKGALRAALAHPLENRPWREWLTAVLNSHEALERALTEASGDQPSGFWSQREWEDWSNDLAMLLPEDDVCEYANPDGAQESIIEACLTAYVAERASSSTPEGSQS